MRKESHLLTACLKYLRILENQGFIFWHDRLNSGRIYSGKYMIRLCREGTPDAYFIMSKRIVWLEMKTKDGKLSEAQLRFKDMVTAVGHTYAVIRDIYDLQKLWHKLLNDK